MNLPDPTTRDALLVRANAHAAECWENHWAGGYPELFLQVAAPLTADSPEHELSDAVMERTRPACRFSRPRGKPSLADTQAGSRGAT